MRYVKFWFKNRSEKLAYVVKRIVMQKNPQKKNISLPEPPQWRKGILAADFKLEIC